MLCVQRAWKILSAIINIITPQRSLRDILPASWLPTFFFFPPPIIVIFFLFFCCRQDSPSPADRKKKSWNRFRECRVACRERSRHRIPFNRLILFSLLLLRVVRMRRNVYDGTRKLDEDSRFPPVFTGTLTFDFVFFPSYRVYDVWKFFSVVNLGLNG